MMMMPHRTTPLSPNLALFVAGDDAAAKVDCIAVFVCSARFKIVGVGNAAWKGA